MNQDLENIRFGKSGANKFVREVNPTQKMVHQNVRLENIRQLQCTKITKNLPIDSVEMDLQLHNSFLN